MERSFGFDGAEDAMCPRFDVSETDQQFEVSVDLPGMKAEDFTIEFSNGELWISGERKCEHEDKGKTWHRIERSYGTFRRGIPLTEAVKSDKITAEYKDGVLCVTVPKDEKAQPKRITVSAK
jgi:HSP20 family protein